MIRGLHQIEILSGFAKWSDDSIDGAGFPHEDKIVNIVDHLPAEEAKQPLVCWSEKWGNIQENVDTIVERQLNELK